jgi:hypothetical protein
LFKVALALTAAGICWAAHDVWAGLPWQGLGIWGACVTGAVRLSGAEFADLPRTYLLAAAAVTIGGFGHFYWETPFLDIERQEALSALTTAFLDIAFESPPYEHPYHVRELALQAVGFCSQQPLADAQATAVEAMKLAYEPPALSIIGRAATPQNPGRTRHVVYRPTDSYVRSSPPTSEPLRTRIPGSAGCSSLALC